jgi:predicted MFS family arabinose efflux permease
MRDYARTVRGFSRNARLYLTGLCLMAVNFHVFMLLLNLYLKDLGYLEDSIGWVNAARSIGMTAMAIPAAFVISRIRLKPVLFVCAAIFAVFGIGLATTEKFHLMIGFAVVSGAAFAVFRVASGPFFMRNSTPEERTHLFSMSFAMWILAGMFGSVSSGQAVVWLTNVTGDVILGYRYTLYAGIGFSLLALIPYAVIRAARPSADERRILLPGREGRRRWRLYGKLTGANFLIGMGAGLSIPFLNLYFRDRFGLTADTIGVFYFCVMTSMFIGSLTGPVIARRLGLVRTVLVTQGMSIPFLIVLAFSHDLSLAFVAYLVRGGLMNLGVPITHNLAMELSDDREQGLVNALLMISWTGSWALSNWLGGEIIKNWGFTVSLNATAVLYVLSMLVFSLIFWRVERRRDGGSGWYIPGDTRL